MFQEAVDEGERLVTFVALVDLLFGVRQEMALEVGVPGEGFPAHFALVAFLFGVR